MKQTQSRKRKTVLPCPKCRLHLDRCICAHIPSIDLKTHLTLIIHHRELKRTTNTGQLAIHALSNSQMIVRGRPPGPSSTGQSVLKLGYTPLILIPADDAIELSTQLIESITQQTGLPVQLIVPDGNWRQASKVKDRVKELTGVIKIKLPSIEANQQVMRLESKPNGMATLEAIAYALGLIEGPINGLKARTLLLELYQQKLKQTLRGRQNEAC